MQHSHRSDIEGLRAISVIVVVLYHAGISGVEGGFLGVDIFFVISGFLITQLIVREIETSGRFSFKNFYVRRARRLLPTLITVSILSSILAFLILSPAHFKEFAQSLGASIVGLANLYFYAVSGYFETDSSLRPFLHNWSLSVEEQFYLIWPLLIIVTLKLAGKKSLILFSMVLFASSLYLNYLYLEHASARFYLLPFRCFELLLGAFFALVVFRTKLVWLSCLLSLCGLILIGFSVIAGDEDINHPSMLTLIPCIGASLIIISGNNPISSALLSNKIFTFIGERSYTIYMVHWPLFVFFNYGNLAHTSTLTSLTLCLAAVLLSLPIYQWIEKPFRKGQYRFQNTPLVTSARLGIVSVIGIFVIVGLIIRSDGAAWRVNSQSAEWADNSLYGGEICAIPCHLNEEASPNPSVYVVGDSFARQLAVGLKQNFPDVRFKIFDHRQCSFFSPTWIALEKGYEESCLEEQGKFFEEIRQNKPKIIFANHWAREAYYQKVNGVIETIEFERYEDDHARFIYREIQRFTDEFAINDILVFGNPPSIGKIADLDACINRPLWLQNRESRNLCSKTPRKDSEDRRYLLLHSVENLKTFDLFEPFCDDNLCSTLSDEGYYFSDNVHLTKLGSRKAISFFYGDLKAWIEDSQNDSNSMTKR